MDNFANILRRRASEHKKKIILPEMDDGRVREAADILEKEGIADPIRLSKDSLSKDKIEKYAAEFFEMRKSKGITKEDAFSFMSNPLFYGAMELKYGNADGLVAGAVNTTANMVRSVLYCIGIDRRDRVISGAFIMLVPGCEYGEKGVFVFSDCAVIPSPNPKQLANIGISAAELAKGILGVDPRIAFLSFSSKGSADSPEVEKVRNAVSIARELAPDLMCDGEFQVDTALVPEIAARKVKGSDVAGKANVLVFPSLEAGNISYKLVERLSKGRAIGPILIGSAKPCSDLSRGCSPQDIVDSAAVVSLLARQRKNSNG